MTAPAFPSVGSTGGCCQLPGLAAVADPTAAARVACVWCIILTLLLLFFMVHE